MRKQNAVFCLGVAALAAFATPGASQARASAQAAASAQVSVQAGTSGYDKPPQKILDVLHASSPPRPLVSPTQNTILLVSGQDYPSMSRVALPFLRLAGVRVEPGNHSKHDTPGGYGITPCVRKFELVRVPDGKTIPVTLPAGACPNSPHSRTSLPIVDYH